MKKLLLSGIILFAFIFANNLSFSQTTIWSEDFDNPADDGVGAVGPIAIGTNTGVTSPSSGKWSVDVTNCQLTASSDWFMVTGGQLEARDVDGTQQAGGSGDGALWTSELIDLSGYTNVSISVDVSGNGTFESQDFVKASYQLDGGTITVFGFLNDDFAAQSFQVNSLTGSNLVVYLEADNNAGSEYLDFDNVIVQGIPSGGNIPPIITNIVTTPSEVITSSTTVSVSADVTDSDGSITNVELHYGTVSGSLGTTIAMSNTSGDTYTTDTDIPAYADGITVYFEIAATDDEPETSTSSEHSYTVMDPVIGTLPYNNGFDPDLGDMYSYSVTGPQVWGITTFGNPGPSARMNGYSGGAVENEDWLITPSFDFTSLNNVYLSFDEAINYGSSPVSDNAKIMVSTDYVGIGDPTSATWAELTAPNRSTGTSWDFVPSGNIDLAAYIGNSNVHLAFKYTSSSSAAATWEVDNVVIGSFLNYYNLQWPPSDTIPSWYNYDVYAQAYEPGVTDAGGQGAGIECWIGYSTVDEDPSISTNFTYITANYNGDAGSNDEYKGVLAAAIPMAPGTYYYVARWRFNGGPYHYGGYNGPWDAVNNPSGVLTIDPSAATSTWTGGVDDNWFEGGNWSDGVPGYNTDVTIPTGLTNYPKTTGGTAMCNNILIQSDATGDASFIEYGNLIMIGTATVEKFIITDIYHSFSPSVVGQTAGIFHLPGSTGLDVYLYGHIEANNADPYDGYYEIVDVGTPLMPMAGYAVFAKFASAKAVTGWTFTEEGVLNSGTFGTADNMTRTGAGTFAGFNYVGNPYPSNIDWDAAFGWTKTNVTASTWIENNGGWAQYTTPGPSINGGSQYIAPGQGFFVEVDPGFGTGTLMMNDDVRSNMTTPFLKSTVSNYVKLAAIGNEKTDEMVVRFDENATDQYESQYDGVKLAAADANYPQIYSMVDDMMVSYNALPETDMVQLGFTAGVSGEYTISAVDVSDISSVWLEDTFTNEITNLKSNSYIFNYEVGDTESRFILHFTPLKVDDNAANLYTIFAANNEIRVLVPANTSGNIMVYNLMGQEIISSQINGTRNNIHMNESGTYLVKVIGSDGVSTKKVFIK